ncbi:reticulon-like protein B21 [Aristolochia californica]|uniref:reticulon-like protein B21 n=1 Tax=Aristolochia californica TaxID=171875 RepID=UPI0035D639B7
MQVGRGRGGIKNGVVTGSVWESRMKLDEVKGGIKVFHGGEAKEEEGVGRRLLKRNKSDAAVEKRRRWKPETDKLQMQLRKTRSDCRRVNDGTNKELGVGRGKTIKPSLSNESPGKSSNVVVDDADDKDEEVNGLEQDEEKEEIEKESFEIKEMNVAEEKPRKIEQEEQTVCLPPIPKLLSPATEDQRQLEPPVVEPLPQISKLPISADDDQEPVAQPVPEQLPQISELPISAEEDQKLVASPMIEHLPQISKSPISANEDEKPLPQPEIERLPPIPRVSITVKEDKKPRPSPFGNERLPQSPMLPICANKIRKSLPPSAMEHPSVDPDFKKKPSISVAEEIFQSTSVTETHNRMQNMVDLVMWKDIPKSALVFGLGTFVLISSSFAKDLKFSFISAISYIGLFYLALVFFYKSILLRGAVDYDDSCQKYIVGEEEAIWVAKLILPYFNELLFKLRSLFSGDPATTLRLAILLFVSARCGSSITIWTMAKLTFFGVFTVPKLCCTYSTQLTGYVRFWVGRFQDAWDSCTHKKAAAAAIFTVIWNLSSVVARIWAVFILVVGVKYYQQSLFGGGNWESAPMEEASQGGPALAQRHRRVPTTIKDLRKEKKGS